MARSRKWDLGMDILTPGWNNPFKKDTKSTEVYRDKHKRSKAGCYKYDYAD